MPATLCHAVPARGPRHDGSPGETNPVILARRQRQIDFGKNNPAYRNYLATIPRDKRFPGCPRTPDPYRKAPRRWFDNTVKQWKIDVHICNDAIKLVAASRTRHGENLLTGIVQRLLPTSR